MDKDLISREEVGRRIKNIRVNHNMNLEQFAEEIGTGKSNVSKWERGKNLPNDLTLKKIADFADITVNELLYGSFSSYLYNIFDQAEKDILNEFPEISNNSLFTDPDKKALFYRRIYTRISRGVRDNYPVPLRVYETYRKAVLTYFNLGEYTVDENMAEIEKKREETNRLHTMIYNKQVSIKKREKYLSQYAEEGDEAVQTKNFLRDRYDSLLEINQQIINNYTQLQEMIKKISTETEEKKNRL